MIPSPNLFKTIKRKIIFTLLFFYQFRPNTFYRKLYFHCITNKTHTTQPDSTYLKHSMEWLSRAQYKTNDGGVSAVFYLSKGWDVSYPETSGYIIPTFIAYSELENDPEYLKKAVRIGDWEIAIQTKSGGVLSRPTKTITRVFNTGQVILGWCCLYKKTKDNKFLEAACKAADYLINLQESNGSWERDTHCGARTYHARVDWALLVLFQLTQNPKYKKSAILNLYWVMQQVLPNGWFQNCGFNNDLPNMHVISYTLRGLLECSIIDEEIDRELEITSTIIKTAKAIWTSTLSHPVRNIPGLIPLNFNSNWDTADTTSCLTGNAQFACFLYRLNQKMRSNDFADQANMIINALKKTVIVNPDLPDISGALAGSFPLYIGYMNQAWPNWASKFFADALMMKNHFSEGLTIEA